MPIADRMKTTWMMVCQSTPSVVLTAPGMPRPRASMNVFSRWIDEIPTIAIASLIFSTLALTWSSHSG